MFPNRHYIPLPEICTFCSEIGTRPFSASYRGKETRLRVVVGISGASGAIYGLRLLERLREQPSVEIHLILSRSGEKTLFLETGKTAADVRKMADYWYPLEDIGCRLASGSFPTDAMVIAPCSIHTMSAIAQGISSNLLVRAADVSSKGKTQADFTGSGKSFPSGPSEKYDCISGNGRHNRPANSRLLPQSDRPWWKSWTIAWTGCWT